ncbi:MAG: hypothetical protein JWP26_3705 [Devosia sp.]|nr:hypothetical protein [Devosia sp.]MDB5588735.1 hypothetical protein [Devosia sp.]
MIGWLLKKVATAQPAPPRQEEARVPSPEACAIWHDVVRALDAKPKSAK